ncbi:hypothetical protein TRFO_34423 [Tritrichomonas foetus]|uniref:Uncharacterized protein n=1 Tax=Tritrichomonas foetus TaxID=1144522 RepID=A0A1J4JPI5_9EUKA|nr:hypothetical protein TRFO_34423 [Tritrichomonas foetus]|eukprot:OHS99180.1 hypothetical protein TRFO_34423 [Tritrichomonas foetus]
MENQKDSPPPLHLFPLIFVTITHFWIFFHNVPETIKEYPMKTNMKRVRTVSYILPMNASFWYQIWNEIAGLDEEMMEQVMNSIFNNHSMSFTVNNFEFLTYKGKEMYDIIYKHQNPPDCSLSQLRFFEMSKHFGGLGSNMHILGNSLGHAMNSNAIFYLSPHQTYSFIGGDFCKNSIGMQCFVEPLTKCTPTHSHGRAQAYFGSYPSFMNAFLEGGPVPKNLYRLYWDIYSSLYLMRFNQRTIDWMKEYRSKALINPMDCYDISIHVRHGDKHTEMTLIDDSYYLAPIKIIKNLLGREPTIFLSTEDNRTIDFFLKHKPPYKVSYYKYERANENFKQLEKRGAELSLISWANFVESLNCAFHIGTYGSNWNRLIFEVQRGEHALKLKSNKCLNNNLHWMPYFEVGDCGRNFLGCRSFLLRH